MPRVVVFQAFDAADGQIIIAAANDRLFAKLASELGHSEWASDTRFRTNPDGFAHRDVLIPMVEEIVKQRPRAHWVERLDAVGVPCSRLTASVRPSAGARRRSASITMRRRHPSAQEGRPALSEP